MAKNINPNASPPPPPPPPLSPAEIRRLAADQIAAGIRLIENSKLLTFDKTTFRFAPVKLKKFEDDARTLDQDFGRVMYWIWFSTGAEYIFKGYMLLKKPNFSEKSYKPVPLPPIMRKADWAGDIIRQSGPKEYQDTFGTLGFVDGLKDLLTTPIKEKGIAFSPARAKEIEAIYVVLRGAIRNRDSHAFLRDVRAAHFHMTNDFGPAFSDLLAAAEAKQLLTGSSWSGKFEPT